ncbi:MAG: RraA family protein [Burkholderiaceae bacterium]
MTSPITRTMIESLRQFDTPTICNALELVIPERRGYGFTVEHMVCRDPSMPPFVGLAKTATIRAVAPSIRTGADASAHRVAYYEYVADTTLPTVSVIQDLDPNPGVGAFWGEVNTAIHKGLGCEGVVTNGSIRDLDQCAPGFQLLAGMIGPSHAFVHTVDFGGSVNVFGMTVSDGDLIHADCHGAVVIPAQVVNEIAGAVDLLVKREAVVLSCARAEGFSIEHLRQALSQAAEIH